jgi:hypothetical protein
MNGDRNPASERTTISYDTKAPITVVPDPNAHPAKSTVAPPRSVTVPVTPPP